MKTHSTVSARGRGFTIIELIIVLAIAAVLATLAAPRYINSINRYRADVAARRIAADLALAQSRARATSSSRVVAFDLSHNNYRLNGEADPDSLLKTYTVELSAEPYRVAISTVSFGGNATLSFNGYGVPDSSGSVQIKCGKEQRTIDIDGGTGVTSIR